MPEGGSPGVSPPGTATVSNHETGTPPGTAAVSKHETGTVAKQTAGALQFMVDFALRGGGLQHLREYVSLHCALGGGRSVPAKTSTPLA